MAERNVIDIRENASDIANKYAEHLQHKIRISGIYLFGSYAKGLAHEDSDIDIAVVSDSFTGDPVDDLTTLLLLKSEVDNRIEPHPFLPDDFTRDNPFVEEILKTAIRIA